MYSSYFQYDLLIFLVLRYFCLFLRQVLTVKLLEHSLENTAIFLQIDVNGSLNLLSSPHRILHNQAIVARRQFNIGLLFFCISIHFF